MYDEFVEDYEPTKADSYRKKVSLLFACQQEFNIISIFLITRVCVSLGGFRWGRSANRYS